MQGIHFDMISARLSTVLVSLRSQTQTHNKIEKCTHGLHIASPAFDGTTCKSTFQQ